MEEQRLQRSTRGAIILDRIEGHSCEIEDRLRCMHFGGSGYDASLKNGLDLLEFRPSVNFKFSIVN